MSHSPRHGAFALGVLLALTACTPEIVKKSAPPIGDVVDKPKPDDKVLPIIPSEQIAVDPKKAADNYRKLLALKPDDKTQAESMRRLADLQVQMEDARGNDAPESTTSIKEAIQLYNDLLYKQPDDPNNDRVFYQLARAYQNIGDMDAAIDTLARLTTRYPQSDVAGDAHFRRAELLFARTRYADAEAEYKVVMDLADATPFFQSAQYKYGWARYKQANYEGAIETFSAILERELPPGALYDTKLALEAVAKNKSDLARDSLRVVSLSFAALGGGKAVNEYFAKHGAPRFYPLVYTSLGELELEKERYSEAAETYAAFIERYPTDAYAPAFQTRVIKAYDAGGFHDLVAREKERYVTTYDPSAPYWAGKPASAEVMSELRLHLEDLAKHYYAKAQAQPKPAEGTTAAPPADFLVAAKWYRRIIQLYPKDPQVAQINFMVGESLYNGGQTLEAAKEYMHTAYDYPPHRRSDEAGYAAVLAYERYAKEVKAEERPAVLRETIASSMKFADAFPKHAQVARVLTRSAEDLYELKDYDEAIVVAGRVITFPREVDINLRRSVWSVTADSQFALKKYPEAEKAYTQELNLTARNTAAYAQVTDQLAAAIYKQGEAARDAGDLRSAALQFLRVGKVVPFAKIHATADYDGATMLIQLKDWPAAETVLEGFRTQFPGHALEADVDKKLAVVYQSDNKPLQAAQAYRRIAARTTETNDTRREAAWLAATLFDQAKSPDDTTRAYEFYVTGWPRPLQRAMDSRRRLADLARDRNDQAKRMYWLRELIAGDEGAGAERSDQSRGMGATAALEIGRLVAAEVKGIALTLPLEKSLPRKKQAMDAAINALSKAANYGYAEITTAATYELGVLYQDFGKSITDSERPKKLSAMELEQYNVLVEEQAYPFEEKAISTHEANLKRIAQGVYDQWVVKSARALAAMAPAKYGKREKGEDSYATLK